MNLNATLLGEMITFSIFIWFTMRFVMPPVMHALEERRAQAAETVENNSASKRKLKEAEAAKTAAIQAAEAEGKDIREQAREEGKAITAKIEQNARSKAEKTLADSKAQAELLQQQTEAEIKEKFIVPLVLRAVESVLKQNVNEEVNQALVEQAITEDS